MAKILPGAQGRVHPDGGWGQAFCLPFFSFSFPFDNRAIEDRGGVRGGEGGGGGFGFACLMMFGARSKLLSISLRGCVASVVFGFYSFSGCSSGLGDDKPFARGVKKPVKKKGKGACGVLHWVLLVPFSQKVPLTQGAKHSILRDSVTLQLRFGTFFLKTQPFQPKTKNQP